MPGHEPAREHTGSINPTAQDWTLVKKHGRDRLVKASSTQSAHRAAPTASELAPLVRRAAGGDRAAFREWLEATYSVVFRVALRILGDPAGAQDVTQEAFVQAWQNMARLRKLEASLAWVCRIARNVAADRLRGAIRREVLMLDRPTQNGAMSRVECLASPEPGPEAELLVAETRAQVRVAVASLKDKHRVVLLLREVDGMSYEEIATALGVPRGTVESRIHRARALVKKWLRRAALREARSQA